MSRANLNINVVEKRMYNPSEAAHYCGVAIKHFKALCPVAPVSLLRNEVLYDRIDLDAWIDTTKSGSEVQSREAILAKLA